MTEQKVEVKKVMEVLDRQFDSVDEMKEALWLAIGWDKYDHGAESIYE